MPLIQHPGEARCGYLYIHFIIEAGKVRPVISRANPLSEERGCVSQQGLPEKVPGDGGAYPRRLGCAWLSAALGSGEARRVEMAAKRPVDRRRLTGVESRSSTYSPPESRCRTTVMPSRSSNSTRQYAAMPAAAYNAGFVVRSVTSEDGETTSTVSSTSSAATVSAPPHSTSPRTTATSGTSSRVVGSRRSCSPGACTASHPGGQQLSSSGEALG